MRYVIYDGKSTGKLVLKIYAHAHPSIEVITVTGKIYLRPRWGGYQENKAELKGCLGSV